MTKKRQMTLFVIVLALVLLMFAMMTAITELGAAESAMAGSTIVEYPVPGSPKRIAVEAPGRVWFTLSDQNAIGHLVVTSTTEYEVITYTVPTLNSTPYDLVYKAGSVWFTEYTGNKIGRLNTMTGAIDEFDIPTSESSPTGIDIAPNGEVWFVEQNTDHLARLVVTSTVDYRIDEFVPSLPTEGLLQAVDVQNDDNIWFTAPGANCLLVFQPSKDRIFHFPTSAGFTPWDVVAPGAWPWISARGANLLGRYSPQTTGNYTWFSLDHGEEPMGIAFDTVDGVNRTWFVANASGHVGRLDTDASQGTQIKLLELSLPSPNSQPEDIAVDSNGHAWITESGTNKIAEWRPPYVRVVYLPLVLK